MGHGDSLPPHVGGGVVAMIAERLKKIENRAKAIAAGRDGEYVIDWFDAQWLLSFVKVQNEICEDMASVLEQLPVRVPGYIFSAMPARLGRRADNVLARWRATRRGDDETA